MLSFLIAALIGCGIFLFWEDMARIPFIKTSMAVHNLAKRQRVTSGLQYYMKGLTAWLARHLKLSQQKKAYLSEDLRTAQMEVTAEEYCANAIVQGLLFAAASIPFFLISFPLGIGVLLVAFMRYRREMGKVTMLIKDKRDKIEAELPRLVSSIEKSLCHNRDVLYILESYQRIAGTELRSELNLTISDMKSGSYETAIARLETRVGSTMMGDVCRGLIAILRGDDNLHYWGALNMRFTEIVRQRLRQQAQKVPERVSILSMCLLGCFILIYVVVIVQLLVSSIGILF